MSSSSVNGSTTGSQIPTSHQQQQQCQEGGIDHTKEEKSPASHPVPSSSLSLVEYHAFASLVDEVGAPIRLGGESSNLSPSQFAVARQTHVRYDSNLTSQPPPSLTGRTHQRFEGEARLVCGCVPFRIDRIPCKRRRVTDEEENKKDAADDASVTLPTSPPSVDDESEYDLRLSVLLVHAKKKGDWIFAKGGWEEFETAGECAQREALEEGGVEGELISQLTPIAFTSKKGKLSQMTPFLLRVTRYHQHFAEAGKRHRRWIPYHQVDQFMKREETKEIWENAKEKLRECGWMDEKEKPIWKEEEINPRQH